MEKSGWLRKTEQIAFRCTTEQRLAIEKAASRSRIPLSEFCRRVLVARAQVLGSTR